MLRVWKPLAAVSVIMACILSAPAASPVSPAAYFCEEAAGPGSGLPLEREGPFTTAEGGHEMKPDPIREQMRLGIVEKSIEVLRRHGKSEDEIRAMMRNCFHIGEKALQELMSKNTG